MIFKNTLRGLIACLSLTCVDASAQIIRTNDLNKYCDQAGVNRQTVLYLDQGIISKTDALWFKDIVNKIKFLPSEKVKVVTIKHGGSEVELAWEACYPGYTPENAKDIKENESAMTLFTGSKLDAVKDDVEFFFKNFQLALAHPLATTKYEDKPRFSLENFPQKKLVEALYYDSKRLDLKNGVSRVVVFSDMIENSNLITHAQMKPVQMAKEVAERFPMFLNHADFYIYGINYTHSESDLNSDMEKFWRSYLLASGANIAHYGNQLVIPNSEEYFSVFSYTGHLVQSDGRKVIAKMRLGYLKSGELTHSVLTIGDEFMPLKGSLILSGQNVQLEARVSASTFDGFKPGDSLTLDGSLEALKGTLGAPDERTVDTKGKQYRFKLVMNQDSNLSL
jgi:hypothetical protein